MHLLIDGFRGIARAEVEILPLCLIAGRNMAGKSSIAEALAISLQRRARANASRKLLRDGMNAGRIETLAGGILFEVPITEATAKDGFASDREPIASAVACGLATLPKMRHDDAAAHIADFDMSAEVTDKDIADALTEIGIAAPEAHKEVAARVRTKTWDGALKDAKDRGDLLRSQWQAVAEAAFDMATARDWRPADWNMSCEFPFDVVSGMVRDYRDALQLLTKPNADGSPPTDAQSGERRVAFLQEETRKREREIAECERKHRALSEPRDREAVIRLEGQIRNLRRINADAELEIGNVRKEPASAIIFAQESLSGAEVALRTVERKRKADAILKQIELNIKLQGLLGPRGVRTRVLSGAIAKLNLKLKEVADKAGWKATTVAPDFAVSYDGRPFGTISRTERYRATATLQIAAAINDKSAAIIVEDLDTLDRAGRNALLRAIRAFRLKALLTMTADDPGDVPMLDDTGAGTSYWIEGGEVLTLKDARKAERGAA